MTVLIENRQDKVNINVQRMRQVAERILRNLNCQDKELSLVLLDDDEIRKINRDYLGRDYPTNVISFSLLEGKFSNINPHMLGDIVISTETACRHANEEKIPLQDELDFLMIHGLLHLLGYNHEGTSCSEAAKMKEKEQELFAQIKGYFIE